MEEGDKLNQDFKNSIEFLKFLESKLGELGFMLTDLKQYYNEYHILFNKLNEEEKNYFKETFPILFLLYSQNKTDYVLFLKILLKEFENLEYSASLSDRDTGDGMNLSIKITNAGADGNTVVEGTIDEDNKIINFPRLDMTTNFSALNLDAKLSDGATLQNSVLDFSMDEETASKTLVLRIVNQKRYKRKRFRIYK